MNVIEVPHKEWDLSLKHFSFKEDTSEMYNHKCTLVCMWSTRYYCQILMKLEFSGQIFEKYSNIQFHVSLFSGSRIVPRGQKDRRDKASSRLFAISRTCLKMTQKITLWEVSRLLFNVILSWRSNTWDRTG